MLEATSCLKTVYCVHVSPYLQGEISFYNPVEANAVHLFPECYLSAAKFSPDSNNLAPVEDDAIHLSDEDGGHSLIKRCAVHVDGGTHWEDKAGYSLVDAQVLL